jgi:hypothetical protein
VKLPKPAFAEIKRPKNTTLSHSLIVSKDTALRILYTVHGYKPAYRLGGPVISVSEVAERLVRRGHEVIVFTSDSNLDETLDVPVNQPVKVD